MAFTIEFGWWILPAWVTLAAFFAYRVYRVAIWSSQSEDEKTAYFVYNLLLFLAASTASLAAWLIWALFT